MLIFNKDVGIFAEDTYNTRNRIAKDWIAAFTKDGEPTLRTSPESPAGQLIDAEAALVSEKDADILKIAEMLTPDRAEGIWQDNLVKWFGITRRLAAPPLAFIQCRGLVGTVIPRGSLVSTREGAQFKTERRITIPDGGLAMVDAYAVDPELDVSNIQANDITRIVTFVPGWDRVTNPEPPQPGVKRETDAELEARRKLTVEANGCGSLGAMYARLLQVEDVEFVAIQENNSDYPQAWTVGLGEGADAQVLVPPHSIAIIVDGGDKDKIAEVIYRTKSAGCGTFGTEKCTYVDSMFYNISYDYWIIRPVPMEIDFLVTLTGWPGGLSISDWELAIKDAIQTTFRLIYGVKKQKPETIDAAKFYCPVIEKGVSTLYEIKIAAPIANTGWQSMIKLPVLYKPALGAIKTVIK